MKNRLAEILTVITMVILLFIGYTVFCLRHAEKVIPESDIYSARQINSALNSAARYSFPILPNCRFTKFYYDEEMNVERGGDKNSITVFCDFEVVFETPVWEKGNVMHGWSWYMEKICGIWIVTNYGFG